MDRQWQERKRPARLERRYEFPDYTSLSDFLDRAADLSEEHDLYPDLGFGRDYVNVTIHAPEGEDAVSDEQRRFADLLDKLQTSTTIDN